MSKPKWVEHDDAVLAVIQDDGYVQGYFIDHYNLNEETGEMEPAEPPIQENEKERKVVRKSKLPDKALNSDERVTEDELPPEAKGLK